MIIMTESKVYDMVLIAFFSVLMAVCAWICIPGAVPFTLQTLGVFLTLDLLGGRRGTAAIGIYILLGCIGIPVFSGFSAGIGVLAGSTGGYILGFLCSGLIFSGMEKLFGSSLKTRIAAMVAGLLACYFFGTVWYMAVYTANTGPIGITAVLAWCVVPFVIPDLIKMGLALFLGEKLRKLRVRIS